MVFKDVWHTCGVPEWCYLGPGTRRSTKEQEELMTTTTEREYRTIDKSAWGPGPWTDEPDKVQWTDTATGLPCLAKRNPRGGHWCG
jgi:hypothetical protein